MIADVKETYIGDDVIYCAVKYGTSLTTDTITEYCKDHNLVLCEKGTEGDAISRQAVLKVLTGGEIEAEFPKINQALKNIINALPGVIPIQGKMLKCPNCKLELHSSFKKCPRCGEDIRG